VVLSARLAAPLVALVLRVWLLLILLLLLLLIVVVLTKTLRVVSQEVTGGVVAVVCKLTLLAVMHYHVLIAAEVG